MQRNTLIFYKQPVFKQLALGWQTAKQLWGFNPFPLSNNHFVKSVRTQSYSGSHFSRIFPHSDWIRVVSPNAAKSGKYADQNNSEHGHFLRCEYKLQIKEKWSFSFVINVK